jgi:hypothetical protein
MGFFQDEGTMVLPKLSVVLAKRSPGGSVAAIEETCTSRQVANIRNQMELKMKSNAKKSPPALAKGQLWKTEHAHIRIMELGKRLVHYKMLRDLRRRQKTQMSGIDNMEVYLKTNRAQLVESGAVAA